MKKRIFVFLIFGISALGAFLYFWSYKDFINAGFTHVCGDWVLGSWEQCDDSNVANGDGCNSMCKLEKKINPKATCWNNIIELSEQCDDGNLMNWDYCNSTCKLPNKCVTINKEYIKNGDFEKYDPTQSTAGFDDVVYTSTWYYNVFVPSYSTPFGCALTSYHTVLDNGYFMIADWLKNWYDPGFTTTDYFHKACSLSSYGSKSDRLPWPQKWSWYIWIVWINSNLDTGWVEYAFSQTDQLLSWMYKLRYCVTLETGNRYGIYWWFWIAISNQVLSQDMTLAGTWYWQISIVPQVMTPPIYSKNWWNCYDKYVIMGSGSKYITIWVFNNNVSKSYINNTPWITPVWLMYGASSLAYYYIDDVSLKRCKF